MVGIVATNRADDRRGNAETLRRYWTVGLGGVKIGWGTPGDWRRCVVELTPHMGERARGYCNLLHKRATGRYPGRH